MSDPRFSRLRTDPRFRRPRKYQSKIVVDERFKDILADDEPRRKGKGKGRKGKEARVDKYGRKLSETQERDDLKRFYRLEGDEEEDRGAQAENDSAIPTILDYARGAVLMESSDEEEDERNPKQGVRIEDDDLDESGSDTGGFITLGDDHFHPKSRSKPHNNDEELEIDLDEDTIADLDAQVAAYNKNVPSKDEVPDVRKTTRLAVVNLDWDYVRAVHLYKIFSSLVSPNAPRTSSVTSTRVQPHPEETSRSVVANIARGSILSVRVYPSEFGKKMMAREEKEGPPPEVFKKKKNAEDNEEVNAKTIYETGTGEDYDEDALRTYQLERLRYYYAIVECDTVETATHVYNELEGTELERSANAFDLSFVPDGMLFDEECRDEATEESDAPYKAVDFVTDALRHSKVKLTWDEDDAERNHFTRRPLTKKEIEEADFRAYIASSSSSSSEDEESDSRQSERKNKAYSKAASRDKLRALLLGGNDEELPEGWGEDAYEDGGKRKGKHGSDLDMEVTFMPGLSEVKNPDDENTLEKYQRKMKEKRRKKKEEIKSRAGAGAGVEGIEGKKLTHVGDVFFGTGSASETGDNEASKEHKGQKAREAENALPPRQPTSREELALLVASDNPVGEAKHFDLKAILKAEKRKGRHGKKRFTRNNQDEDDGQTEIQDDFVIDVKDERFKALHEDHQFAIDPSNPHFKKTKSMANLLDERSKRQKSLGGQDDQGSRTQGAVSEDGDRSLQNLVERVKRKSATANQEGLGKRRKL
ncbi:hypothetical protein F5I97DRAFT_1930559 [Phlebopus sp. FC_14]|nr:hypothetical protein F5I97DRAFT_1930559 [Phlebopus sp. FC_14]